MYTIDEWDSVNQVQITRPATPEEIAAMNAVVAPKPIPFDVEIWKLRSVLIDHALLDALIESFNIVEDTVAQRKIKDKFEYCGNLRFDDTIVSHMKVALSLTQAQVEDLFIEASKI